MTKLRLYLTGPKIGGPTPEDVIAMYERVTGKQATAADVAEVRKTLANRIRHANDTSGDSPERQEQ